MNKRTRNNDYLFIMGMRRTTFKRLIAKSGGMSDVLAFMEIERICKNAPHARTIVVLSEKEFMYTGLRKVVEASMNACWEEVPIRSPDQKSRSEGDGMCIWCGRMTCDCHTTPVYSRMTWPFKYIFTKNFSIKLLLFFDCI